MHQPGASGGVGGLNRQVFFIRVAGFGLFLGIQTPRQTEESARFPRLELDRAAKLPLGVCRLVQGQVYVGEMQQRVEVPGIENRGILK